jgi:hypothetical protein
VIFDPDVYPLDTAFLTGTSVKEEGAVACEEAAPDSGGPAEQQEQK